MRLGGDGDALHIIALLEEAPRSFALANSNGLVVCGHVGDHDLVHQLILLLPKLWWRWSRTVRWLGLMVLLQQLVRRRLSIVKL